jgi:anti-sigma-K factor RskA
MTAPLDNWRPSPELLAAYFDGECEGRDDLSLLKQRIEDWIATHPDAQEELAVHRRLLHVWHQTTPPEPRAEKWAAMLARLESCVPARKIGGRKQGTFLGRRLALTASLAAVVAGMAIYLGWNALQREPNEPVVLALKATPAVVHNETAAPRPDEDDEILPVAHASEVTIIRVEGEDTHTLVVGELPLQGTMELVAPGEVTLTLNRSDWKDSDINPVRLIGGSSPMIWAKLESETDD